MSTRTSNHKGIGQQASRRQRTLARRDEAMRRMQQRVGDVESEGSGGGDVMDGNGTSGTTPVTMVGTRGATHTVPPKQPSATHDRAMNRRLQMME